MASGEKEVNKKSTIGEEDCDRLFETTDRPSKAEQAIIETADVYFANHINWQAAIPQVSAHNFYTN